MKVAMMQPTFLPWSGYFELVLKTDRFIILDDFQFSVQSYHQRNRLLISKGKAGWYTVPIDKNISFMAPLNQTVLKSDEWCYKMLDRLRMNYSKAPYYSEIIPWIRGWITKRHDNLAALNIEFIEYVCDLLAYKGTICYSSSLNSTKKRSERVVELLRWAGATEYYAANGSFGYMYEDGIFPADDIIVLFQDYKGQPYKQVNVFSSFIPNLSILDMLLNIGPENTKRYVESGTEKWRSWKEKVAISI